MQTSHHLEPNANNSSRSSSSSNPMPPCILQSFVQPVDLSCCLMSPCFCQTFIFELPSTKKNPETTVLLPQQHPSVLAPYKTREQPVSLCYCQSHLSVCSSDSHRTASPYEHARCHHEDCVCLLQCHCVGGATCDFYSTQWGHPVDIMKAL